MRTYDGLNNYVFELCTWCFFDIIKFVTGVTISDFQISHAEKTFEHYEANKAAVQKYVFCGWFQELCQNKWCMLSMLICFVCAILMFLHQCGIDVLPMLCGCDDERSIKVDVKK